MWFDEIMDDCKQALLTANKYKGVFIPIFLKAALVLIIGIYAFISFIAGIISNAELFDYIESDPTILLGMFSGIIVNIIIIYLLVLIGNSLIDVGTTNMLKLAVNDEKPKFSDFMDGIKQYFFKVLLGKLFLHLLIVITLPITLALYLIYAVLVGTLTASWGVLFLNVFIAVYFTSWISIVVIEGYSPIDAIGQGFRLARKYFKGLFVILLASTILSSYCTLIFGPMAAVLVGWLIGGVVTTCFRLVIMRIYYRNKESL